MVSLTAPVSIIKLLRLRHRHIGLMSKPPLVAELKRYRKALLSHA
jgi:hypothetical protein